jgi:hypothetical protein
MKKIILIVSAFIVSGIANAQDKTKSTIFEPGNIIVDAGVGVAGYKTVYRTTITVANTPKDFDEKGSATSVIIPIQAEYGFNNWFGLGARFAYSNYFDSTKSNKGVDFDFVLNFHFIKTKRFEMPISLFLGVSNISIKYNDSFNTVAKDNGANNGFMLTPRFYLTDKFGLFVNLGFVNYVYPSVTFSNNNNTNLIPANAKVSIGGMGQTIGFGGLYKF